MRSLYVILICLISNTLHIYGQNLVPNGNFELYTVCPSSPGQIELAQYWTNPLDSTEGEYLNACSSNGGITPPLTAGGYQVPKSGNAYVGLYTYGFGLGSYYRDYIQTPLVDTLVAGLEYYVEFSCAQADFGALTHSCVGVLFTEDSLHYSTLTMIIDTPSVSNVLGNIIQDTALWYTISGVYTAKGTERYLCLGNFVADSLVDTVTSVIGHANAGCNCAYFFFDDVVVSKITGIDETVRTGIRIYPNPAKNYLKVENLPLETAFRIVDLKGRILQNGKISASNPEVSIEELPPGVYLFVTLGSNASTVKFIKE